MNNKDGGPAYSVLNSATNEQYSGMSLRDYFAGQALASEGPADVLCGGPETLEGMKDRARQCYLQADAMISERGE